MYILRCAVGSYNLYACAHCLKQYQSLCFVACGKCKAVAFIQNIEHAVTV